MSNLNRNSMNIGTIGNVHFYKNALSHGISSALIGHSVTGNTQTTEVSVHHVEYQRPNSIYKMTETVTSTGCVTNIAQTMALINNAVTN